jgi:hypothetical protein
MKFLKIFIVLFIVLTITTALKAQTENRSERLITQLKNGTAPGLLFDRSALGAKPAVISNEEKKESLITQIRKGTAPGMKFMPVPAIAATQQINAGAQRTQPGQLASELPAKKETMKTTTAPPVISNQEEVKNEAPAGKQ